MIKTLAAEPQEWEKFRQKTQDYNAATTDDKIEALRSTVSHLNGSVMAMQQTFQHLDREISKLVTRSEFNPVMYIVYGICCSIITGAVFYILSKALLK